MKLDGIMYWVADVVATVDFYTRAFGLEVSMWDDSKSYAQLSTGETTLAFAAESAAAANGATIRPARAGEAAAAVQLALVADDVDAAWERAVGAGAEVVAAIAEKPWGQRLGYLRDPNGFLVELSSPAAW